MRRNRLHPLLRTLAGPLPALLLLASLSCAVSSAADGPGVPNITYDASRVGEHLSSIDTGKAVSAMALHRGLLFVPLSVDDGGGIGDGAFAFYNLQDPSNPVKVLDSRDRPDLYHDPAKFDYVGDWSEIHHINRSGDYILTPERRDGSSGFSIFDAGPLFDDDPATMPKIVSRFSLPGLSTPSSYDGFAWAPGWQGSHYLYIGSGGHGLWIIDTKDFKNPSVVNRLYPNQIDLYARGAFPIGNVLVLSEATVASTFRGKVFDISDPGNPVLMSSFTGPFGYHGFVYGSAFYNAASPVTAFDFTNPSNVVEKQLAVAPFDNPEYGFGKDDNIYVGHYVGLMKFALNAAGDKANFVHRIDSGVHDDHAFLNPLGNLVAMCTDHNDPQRIIICVDSTEKDTQPPRPLFVSPSDGAVNQAITSRVGISFSDFVDPISANSATMEVRNVGTGQQVAGTYSTLMGIVNFAPDEPLTANATYEVVLKAGGIHDQAGNAIPQELKVTRFSTGSQLSNFKVAVNTPQPRVTGSNVSLSLNVTNPNQLTLEHSWDFGDGSPATAFSSATAVSHVYTAPGSYTVMARSRIVGTDYAPAVISQQTVYRPAAAAAPVRQSTIVYDSAHATVWNVNPDNNSVTEVDAATLTKIREVPVGAHPVAVSLGSANQLWVLNEKSSSLTVIDRTSGTVTATYPLPVASAPHGLVVDAANDLVYVTLEARNLLLKISATSGQVLASLPVDAFSRGLALDAVRHRLWISRFITAESGATLSRVNLDTFTLEATVPLAAVMEPDGIKNGRGIANYLMAPVISPDGSQAFVPAKKDNIFRGLKRDGQPLTFEHGVRSMAANLDLATGQERPEFRQDLDNSDFATAAVWSPLGNLAFFTTSGSATIWTVDANDPRRVSSFTSGGQAPDGMAVSDDGGLLFVHNFMDRSVTAFRASAADGAMVNALVQQAKISTVAVEALPPQILKGKQLFYNTTDPRLAQEGYMSCASCHLDGSQDGRVWDFTDLGEGFRNTIDLNGHGAGHGPLHWSANFDEVQDFEGQIRSLARGTGFLPDTIFLNGPANTPLGASKAGLSPELDALAAYVGSLTSAGTSPNRQPDGQLSAAAAAGKEIFRRENCATCHSGTAFSDSALLVRHDVGTLTENSGMRLGGTFDAIDTPTLRGLWKTAPYLHDGSAATLREVLVERNLGGKHADLFHCTSQELDQLVSYLESIDDAELSAPTNASGALPVITAPGNQQGAIHTRLTLALSATGKAPLLWSAFSLPPGLSIDPASGVISGAPSLRGDFKARVAVKDANGQFSVIEIPWTVKDATAFRYVKLSILSSHSGLQRTVIGEINLLDASGGLLNREHWTYTANTEAVFVDLNHDRFPVTNAFDNYNHTYWESEWGDTKPFPHEATIDLGIAQPVRGISLSTISWEPDGRPKDYRVSCSNDGVNWSDFTFQGTFANDDTVKYVMFDPSANKPPVFSATGYHLSVVENSAANTVLGAVTASDPGQQLTYSLGSGNTNGAFAINPATGQIRTVGPIDFETLPFYQLQVIATDNGSPQMTASVIVPVSVVNVIESNQEAVLVSLTKPGGAFAGHGDPKLIDFSADPDGDGIPNAIELLLGTDPSKADAPLPMQLVKVTQNGQDYLAWEYKLAVGSGLSCQLEASADMQHWQPLAQPPVLMSTADGIQTYRVRDDLPLKDTPRRFMRLSVQ